jgi:hypothetical protein
MTLKISNTGTVILQEFADYIENRFAGIYFDSVEVHILDEETSGIYKTVNIQYPGLGLTLPNSICIEEQDLTQNIIDWLNTL